MKLISFVAKKVHGYLDFNIKFNMDVNFIAGLNGSGKTTALNLMAGMLTPSLEDLAKIEFGYAKLVIQTDNNQQYELLAEQIDEQLMVRVFGESSLDEKIIVASLQELNHTADRSVTNKFRSHEVFKFISRLPSPMYLSLDRRFIKEVSPYDITVMGVNAVFHDRLGREERGIDSGMKEALDLIFKKSAEIKDKQTIEDRKLRNKIILDSFYVDKGDSVMSVPDKQSLMQLKTKQRTIKSALINLDFKDDDLDVMYDRFFDNLNGILKSVLDVLSGNFVDAQDNRDSKASASPKRKDIDSVPSRKKKKDIHQLSLESSKVLGTWFANSHQMARIDRLIKMIREYENSKDKIFQPLMKFVKLVNSFLEQTNKKIDVTNRGEVKIFISGVERPLTILSSGERQILIMLAHLSLNSHLPKSGVFIVDEPELSLHIAWQDMFVEAVQAAGPELQIVLATHSPAIIGGRKQYYIPLNGGI